MKKLLLILISLTFIPVLNAENYYDYEKVAVDELPTASADTMNKVYIKGDSYFVTEKIFSSSKVEVGDTFNYNNQFIISYNESYFDKVVTYFESYGKNYYLLNTVSDDYTLNNSHYLFYLDSNHSFFQFGWYYGKYLSSITWGFIFYPDGSIDYILSDYDLNPCNWFWCDSGNDGSLTIKKVDYSNPMFDFITKQSSVIFSWKEVSKYDVNQIVVSDDDFYLFFTFEDISNFNILSSYNLLDLTDFQKIVIVLGFNIFFLGFIGFVVYVFIKLINKGISLLFR